MNNRSKNILSMWIKNIVKNILDILIPPEEKVLRLERLGPHGLFENIPLAENFDLATKANIPVDKIKAIFCYRNSLCRQAVWEIKYRGNRKLITDFSLLLYEYILEELYDLENFANFRKIILVPIPASKKRDREKGFNQCVLLARELIKIDHERNNSNFILIEDLLVKIKETPHQARVRNKKERLENMKNTLVIKNKKDLNLSDFSFIIIDDVITTGATINEAFRAFRKAGVSKRKIRAFTLAH